eukprot:TRINITY_DN6651_c0_g1_i2.p2 TRINITY_DN6651_c0_g1~~TRINITY_DN6651_c0_g1_i2.p2  ORF type:complete len:237 (+),score=107.62 TRINITY_DN6651_c0_g1_i2:684-1394(+)
MNISLDGLLDYEEEDREESTFELSLFAELFHEMLAYKHGLSLLPFLEEVRVSHNKKREERKRKREEERLAELKRKEEESKKRERERDEQEKDEGEPAEKKAKADENGDKKEKGDDAKKADATESKKTEAKDESKDDKAKEDKEKDEGEKKARKQYHVNWELVKVFRFFDKSKSGYLKADDLKRILHNLNKFLSQRHVKDLVTSALSETRSARDDRIAYRDLTDVEVSATSASKQDE